MEKTRFFINREKKIGWIEIRKNASATMRRFIDNNMKIKEDKYGTIYDDYFIFCIIRNPFDRFITGFISILINRSDWIRKYIDEKTKAIELIPISGDWIRKKGYIPPTSDIDKIKEIVFQLILKLDDIGKNCNVHILPQVDHIPKLCNVNFYILFDSLSDDCIKLGKKLGWKKLDLSHDHMNRNKIVTEILRNYILSEKELYNKLLKFYERDYDLYNKIKLERKL